MEKANAILVEVFSHYHGRREELIPVLQETQDVFGYLPEEAMRSISRFMRMPESQVYGVATFYSQFYFARRGKHKVKVCYGTACHVAGATRVLETFERELGIACGCTSEDYEYSLERVACVGSCALAPVVVVDEEVFGQVDPSKVVEIVRK
ncbi:MAG: NADH-quinone oxidoreductase subunit NuoE [Dethiobacter sp.]|nr:NADH-quinone oxidoreductase subunit NuoE [Dethiobacter sp.]MCL5981921.1 NADH-quinone oxidoreductase subunit NuoE [Bacillota bacterium]